MMKMERIFEDKAIVVFPPVEGSLDFGVTVEVRSLSSLRIHRGGNEEVSSEERVMAYMTLPKKDALDIARFIIEYCEKDTKN